MSEKTHEICEYCGKEREIPGTHICSNVVYNTTEGITIGAGKSADAEIDSTFQLIEALKFYADESIYTNDFADGWSDAELDKGERARKALATLDVPEKS